MRFSGRAIGLLVLGLSGVAGAGALPDPTRPADVSPAVGRSATVSPGGPVLQSILVSPQRKFAMISGRRVTIGDKVNGAVVVDIAPYEVRLDRGGRVTVMRLQPKLAKESGKSE